MGPLDKVGRRAAACGLHSHGQAAACCPAVLYQGAIHVHCYCQRQNASPDPPIPPAGYEDSTLRTVAQMASPSGYRLTPWLYTQSISLGFPSQDFPMEYFSAGKGKWNRGGISKLLKSRAGGTSGLELPQLGK